MADADRVRANNADPAQIVANSENNALLRGSIVVKEGIFARPLEKVNLKNMLQRGGKSDTSFNGINAVLEIADSA